MNTNAIELDCQFGAVVGKNDSVLKHTPYPLRCSLDIRVPGPAEDDEAALTRPATKVQVDLGMSAYSNAAAHHAGK